MQLDDPKSQGARILAAVAIAAAATLLPALPAFASQGSVPSEVTRYATDPEGLIARLDDLFGVTVSGRGVEFDDTTETGAINRAWVFTEAYLRGDDPETAVELANLWTAPILIAEKPVGLATIWINPTTDAPDLADFVLSASVAAALSEVPDDAQLVWDEGRGAWFSLIAGKLIALVPGTSGVIGSTTLGDYQGVASGAPPLIPRDMSGLVGGAILIGATVLTILVVLLVPLLRRRRIAAMPDPDEAPAPKIVDEPKPMAAPQPPAKKPTAKKPTAAPTKKPATATIKKPATAPKVTTAGADQAGSTTKATATTKTTTASTSKKPTTTKKTTTTRT